MGKRISIHRKGISSFLIYLALILLVLNGCATKPSDQEISSATYEEPVIESLSVIPSPTETIVKITSSMPAPYNAFKLNDPSRVILDIRANPSDDLPLTSTFKEGIARAVRFTEGETQTTTTRMMVLLSVPADYLITESENTIRLSLIPKQKVPSVDTEERTDMADYAESDEEVTISEPRIFFQPKPSTFNQVLGIDFTMLDRGKSRLTVTTDKKIDYNLEREGDKSLLLSLSDTTIPPLLLRHLDTIHFRSAIDNVKQRFSATENETSLVINLKEMVPFHVKQEEGNLFIEFGKTSVKPPVKTITPLELAEAETIELAAEQERPMVSTTAEVPTAATPTPQPPTEEKAVKKGFTGEPMYLDFVNADVTHLLRLINEVSDENIIWDPAIAGRKVSMILKDVPWDEALELILQNNQLAKRYVGDNIIWITTKAKMNQILAEEEAEENRRRQKEMERLKQEEEKKVEAPLITEYIPLDFAQASEVRGHITLTERGKMSIDNRTNTIIIKDTAVSIEEAKKTVAQFDTPVKQIMIEARIVDATDDLTQSLGIQWQDGTRVERTDTDGSSVGADFVTNAPSDWFRNIGLAVTQINGLTTWGLDAVLALAEADGTGKTLSAPKVIAREGTAANISSGDTLIIPATENVASTTIDATLSLTVTPTSVSYNDYITLDVVVTDDQAPSSTRILTKSISTTLMIKSGDTVVIGGILKETESELVDGVIGLKDIPIIGWLFKAKQSNYTRSELLIFLTPKVLPFSSDVY